MVADYAETLYRNLVLLDEVRGGHVCLVDDVVASGGHLRACAAKLRRSGVDVGIAIVGGRADDARVRSTAPAG
jgi:predicted amidophosphoribosyltransferase